MNHSRCIDLPERRAVPFFTRTRISTWVGTVLQPMMLIMAVSPSVTVSADNVWVGGASDGNFSSAANWQATPSWSFSNSLYFNSNSNSPSLIFDVGQPVANDIIYQSTFTVARTLQPSAADQVLYFKTRLENQSTATQTITMELLGGNDGAASIQLNPVAGDLVISGNLYNDNGLDFAVFGSTTTAPSLTLNTPLGSRSSQAGVDFVVAGGGRNVNVQVNANQIWGGSTVLEAGTFTTDSGVSLASSDIFLNGGSLVTTSANTFADTATLRVNSGQLSIGGSDTVASLEGTGGAIDVAASATLTVGGADTSTSFAGAITGSGGLAKTGASTLTLSGVNSYSGSTTVTGGTLNIGASGSLSASASVSIASGATLAGGGTIAGSTSIAGTHSPGSSPGIQTFSSDLTYTNGANVDWELIDNTAATGDAGIDYDQIGVGGNLVFVGATTLDLIFNASGSAVDWTDTFWNADQTWVMWDDLSSGTVSNLGNLSINTSSWLDSNSVSFATARPDASFTVSQLGQDVLLVYTAVPEPGTLVMLPAAGLALIGLRHLRRRKTAGGTGRVTA